MTEKRLKKIIWRLFSVVYILIIEMFVPILKKYVLTTFQNTNQSMKKKKMIPDVVGCYYIAVTKRYASLRQVASKHKGNFCCMNCFHSFRTKKEA